MPSRIGAVDAVDAADAAERDAAPERKLALLAFMAAQAVEQAKSAPASHTDARAEPAAPWREGAGAMTPEPGREAGSADETPRPAAPQGRVVTDVTTDAFGAMRLVVDRTATGVHVLIALRDPASLELLDVHRRGLADALAAAGLGAVTLSVARLAEDGTTLAPSRCGVPDPGVDRCEVRGRTIVPRRERPKKRLLDTTG